MVIRSCSGFVRCGCSWRSCAEFELRADTATSIGEIIIVVFAVLECSCVEVDCATFMACIDFEAIVWVRFVAFVVHLMIIVWIVVDIVEIVESELNGDMMVVVVVWLKWVETSCAAATCGTVQVERDVTSLIGHWRFLFWGGGFLNLMFCKRMNWIVLSVYSKKLVKLFNKGENFFVFELILNGERRNY